MANHEGEGKAFTTPPVELMYSRGQMNRGVICIIGYKKKKNMFNQAANTQIDIPIGSLRVQVSRSAGVAMSVVCVCVCVCVCVYLARRQMDSGNKWSTRCPSRCTLWHFPSALFSQTHVSSPNNNLQLSLLEEQNNISNKWRQQKNPCQKCKRAIQAR